VKVGSFSALRHRDFRLLFFGQWVSITGSQMQVVAVNWNVWVLTRSPFALGAVGLARIVPVIVFSLLGGIAADARDRKKVMLVTQTVLMAVSIGLGLLTLRRITAVWPVFLLIAVGGAAMAFDLPARQALVPRLVPEGDLAKALSMNVILFQAATIAGPVVAGWLIAERGLPVVYFLDAASFVAVLAAVLAIRAPGAVGGSRRSPWEDLKGGLAFVWRSPLIVSTMTLDFVATFFASAMALLPIFADQILRVGPRGLGLLYGAPAAGAIVTGLILAGLPAPKAQGRTILVAVAAYGAATILFGLSRSFALSLAALAAAGASDTVSMVLRSTLRQLTTPDALRGRMTSINMVFFMGGPQLGEFEAGLLAGWLSAPASVVIGGAACMAAVAATAALGRTLRGYRSS
jgi:MFS family permease